MQPSYRASKCCSKKVDHASPGSYTFIAMRGLPADPFLSDILTHTHTHTPPFKWMRMMRRGGSDERDNSLQQLGWVSESLCTCCSEYLVPEHTDAQYRVHACDAMRCACGELHLLFLTTWQQQPGLVQRSHPAGLWRWRDRLRI